MKTASPLSRGGLEPTSVCPADPGHLAKRSRPTCLLAGYGSCAARGGAGLPRPRGSESAAQPEGEPSPPTWTFSCPGVGVTRASEDQHVLVGNDERGQR